MNPDIPTDDRNESESETDAADEAEETADDAFIRFEESEVQDRLWIKAVIPILQLRPHDSHNVRLQYAFDRLQIAACERLVRILSSDLPALDA